MSRDRGWGYTLRCECGHLAASHARLPGHPDGAEECYGDEDCDCGRFMTAQPTISGEGADDAVNT